MRKIGDAIIEGKVRGRLMAFVGVLGAVLLWVYFQDHSPRLRSDRSSATVVDVKTSGWQVTLGSGDMLWIYAPPGITVKKGDIVPVVIETYESGNRRVEFDRDRWLAGG